MAFSCFFFLSFCWFIYSRKFIKMCTIQNITQAKSLHPDWLLLDDLVMEKIFALLSFSDRYRASLVCVRIRNKTWWLKCEIQWMFGIFTGVSSMVSMFWTAENLANCWNQWSLANESVKCDRPKFEYPRLWSNNKLLTTYWSSYTTDFYSTVEWFYQLISIFCFIGMVFQKSGTFYA